jgi:hypothetical protein
MNDSLPYLLALGSMEQLSKEMDNLLQTISNTKPDIQNLSSLEQEDIESLIGLSLILEVRLNELRNSLHSVGSRESSHQSRLKEVAETQRRPITENSFRASSSSSKKAASRKSD